MFLHLKVLKSFSEERNYFSQSNFRWCMMIIYVSTDNSSEHQQNETWYETFYWYKTSSPTFSFSPKWSKNVPIPHKTFLCDRFNSIHCLLLANCVIKVSFPEAALVWVMDQGPVHIVLWVFLSEKYQSIYIILRARLCQWWNTILFLWSVESNRLEG